MVRGGLVLEKPFFISVSQSDLVQPSRISQRRTSSQANLLGLHSKGLDAARNSNPKPSLEACWLKHALNFMCEVQARSNTTSTVTAALTKALDAPGKAGELQEEQKKVKISVQWDGDSALLCTLLLGEGSKTIHCPPQAHRKACDSF